MIAALILAITWTWSMAFLITVIPIETYPLRDIDAV